jgi:penicillin V acylase-like amidase (Ntn superfamily)
MKFFSIIAVLLQTVSAPSLACSAFMTHGMLPPLFAKSYDWQVGHGQMIVNKRNTSKTALIFSSGTPLQWTSKFGSLTFSQHGRDFPLSGINEKGLAIEILWLPSTEFSNPEIAPSLNEVQWIQYHLDTAENVSQMIENAKKIKIDPIFAKTHYMACDGTGSCAAFEFLDGKLKVSLMDQVKALTNSEYQISLENLKNYEGFGGEQKIPVSGYGSQDRFVRLAHLEQGLSKMIDPKEREHKAWQALSSVRSQGFSKWNILYDYSQNRVSFRKMNSDGSTGSIKGVHFKNFDFSCKMPVLTLNLDSDVRGDVTGNFSIYSKEENLQMVLKSARELGIPDKVAQVVADYPESTSCLE